MGRKVRVLWVPIPPKKEPMNSDNSKKLNPSTNEKIDSFNKAAVEVSIYILIHNLMFKLNLIIVYDCVLFTFGRFWSIVEHKSGGAHDCLLRVALMKALKNLTQVNTPLHTILKYFLMHIAMIT